MTHHASGRSVETPTAIRRGGGRDDGQRTHCRSGGSGRQNKVEMIAAVALFDHAKLAVDVGRLALPMVKLLVT